MLARAAAAKIVTREKHCGGSQASLVESEARVSAPQREEPSPRPVLPEVFKYCAGMI